MSTSDTIILHMVREAAWREAEALGFYDGSADDKRDGFIHFSTPLQIEGSAAKHHEGADDRLLLVVEAASLGEALRWEKSRGGQLFPHLYGRLPVAKVRSVHALPLGPDGRHIFPPFD